VILFPKVQRQKESVERGIEVEQEVAVRNATKGGTLGDKRLASTEWGQMSGFPDKAETTMIMEAVGLLMPESVAEPATYILKHRVRLQWFGIESFVWCGKCGGGIIDWEGFFRRGSTKGCGTSKSKMRVIDSSRRGVCVIPEGR
jgi:hypothetical protein